MTWADESLSLEEQRRARGYRDPSAGFEEAALTDIAAAQPPVDQRHIDLGSEPFAPIVGDVTPLVTPATATTPGDPSMAATAAGDAAYDAQQPVAPAQSPVAPVPPASPPVAAPLTGAAGVSPVARSMQTLNRASGLDAPAAPGSRANAAPMIRQNTDLAQVGGEKAPDPEAAIAAGRNSDNWRNVADAMMRLGVGALAGPGVVVPGSVPSHASEEAALGAAGRRTADTRFAAQQQAQRGAQQRTATNDAQAQADRDRALSLQERGVAVQEGRAASQGTEETQRTTAAFEGLRQMNAQLPEGQRWTDEQMRTIAANPQVSAQVFGAQRGMQGQGASASEHALDRGAAAERQGAQIAGAAERQRAAIDARHPARGGAGHAGHAPAGPAGAPAVPGAPRTRHEETMAEIERRAQARVEIHQANETQDMERRNEILPGVHATVYMPESEAARLRNGYDSGSNAIGAFDRLRVIAEEFGPTALISPEAAARVRAELIPLRHMVADIQGTGIINPSEVPTINAALADPTALTTMTFGTLDSAINEWTRLSERGVRNTLHNRGVSADEQETAVQGLFHGLGVEQMRARSHHRAAGSVGTGPAAPTPPAGQQAARDPQGRIHFGPAGAAVPQGWTVVGGAAQRGAVPL